MTRSVKKTLAQASELNWPEWAERDDRPLVYSLDHSFDENSQKTLYHMVFTIVTSLEFSSHSRWGAQPPKVASDIVINSFLDWMKTNNQWQKIRMLWELDTQGPWPLPLLLGRYYLRYSNEKTHPKTTETLDFDPMVDSLIDTFLVTVEGLSPGPGATAYKLHLEGLLDSEIATILNLSETDIEKFIKNARGVVKTAFQERKFGT